MYNKFTEEDVIKAARETYGKPICTDLIKEAMLRDTLEEAVDILLFDSMFWDGVYTNVE